jgi:hypothetical protein
VINVLLYFVLYAWPLASPLITVYSLLECLTGDMLTREQKSMKKAWHIELVLKLIF